MTIGTMSQSASASPPSAGTAVATRIAAATAATAGAAGGVGATNTPTATAALKRTTTPNRQRTARQNTVGQTTDLLLSTDDLVRHLGSDYQEIQKRTLTRWVNAQLSIVGDHIDHIETDLKDGKRLLKLLSVVSGQAAPKPEKMNMRIHQLSNVAQALDFLQKQLGPDVLPDIGNEAIVNGDVKKTLALVFFIMLRYQVQLILAEHGEDYTVSLAQLSDALSVPSSPSVSSVDTANHPPTPLPNSNPNSNFNAPAKANNNPATSLLSSLRKTIPQNASSSNTPSEAKAALLYWVRIQLEDYIAANVISSIQDFSRSWRTGLAFCLLIHRHDPLLIPNSLVTYAENELNDKESWRELLTLAFDVAEQHMHIPSYLDPGDLIDVEYPYEPSVMMYVSEYYKVMSRSQRDEPISTRKDKAAKRRAMIALVADIDAADGDALSPQPITCSSPTPMDLPSPVDSEKDHDKLLKKGQDDARAPREAPVPVPMPSARRRTARHQNRVSTLDEEDKVRIRADLTNRLQMQLTGHLPRGVHPTLDQLIAIHDTVMSFIKTNTQTLDEIPEEFVGSQAIAEYIEAVDIIDEQVQVESEHVTSAREARDSLIKPASDDDMLQLTEIQRGELSKLYDVLEREWNDFVALVKATQSELARLKKDLVQTEDGVAVYEKQASDVVVLMDQLETALKETTPPIHPLAPQDEAAAALAEYEAAAESVSGEVAAFDQGPWKAFLSIARAQLPSVRQAVSARHAQVLQQREDLDALVRRTKRGCSLYQRGMAFGRWMDQVDLQLTQVQTEMEKPTTDASIRDLEQRVSSVRLHGIREEYYDLFDGTASEAGYAARLASVEQRYRVVRDWVDQVRVWFIEAGRIRSWIETRIDTLREHEEASVHIDDKDVAELYREHALLKRQIEQFDADDMSRLRAHVKQLTSSRTEELSPADASTIEITLQTLNRLNQLTQLTQRRTEYLDALMARVNWQDLHAQATAWVQGTDRELDAFLKGEAPWTAAADTTPAAVEARVVEPLVKYEQAIAKFDQGQYAKVLDAYQDMEELMHDATFENQQLALEGAFASLMRKSQFCRQVVEQHLAAVDVSAQFAHLLKGGRRLLKEMQVNEALDMDGKRVLLFKEDSAYLVTEIAPTHIPYPLSADGHEAANAAIKSHVQAHSMELAEIAEKLEDLLASRQQNVSMQQKMKLLYEEMVRMAAWYEERACMLQGTPDEDDEGAEEELQRLERERDSIEARVARMETSDYPRILKRMRAAEDAIDASNAVTIDRKALVEALERLEETHQQIFDRLEARTRELRSARKRIAWATLWRSVNAEANTLAHDVWEFIVQRAKYDPHARVEDQEIMEVAQFDTLSSAVADVQDSFEALESAEHLEAQQMELFDKQTELRRLVNYANEAIEQRNSVITFLTRVCEVTGEGNRLQDALDKSRRRTSQFPDVSEAALSGFRSQVQALIELAEPTQQAPAVSDCLQWDFDPAAYHEQVEARIRAMLKEEKTALCRLRDAVERSYDSYLSMNEKKQRAEEYEQRIRALHGRVSEEIQTLKTHQIDMFGEGPVSAEEHYPTVPLQALDAELSDLRAKITPAPERFLKSVKAELGEVEQDMNQLKTLVEEQSKANEVMSKRVAWETVCLSGSRQLKNMYNTLRQSKVEDTSVLDEIQEAKDTFSQSTSIEIQTAYKCFLKSLPSSLTVPLSYETAMDSVERLQKKVDKLLACRRKELSALQQQKEQEDQVNQLLAEAEALCRTIEGFLQDDARWRPGAAAKEGLETRLRNQCAQYEAQIQQWWTSCAHAAHARLDQAASQLKNLLVYANQVVGQRCLVETFQSRVAELEQAADRIREDITHLQGSPDRQALQEFRTQVKGLQTTLVRKIPYPVRKDVDSAQRIDDASDNEMIRNTVLARQSYLNELASSLTRLLESKEKLTRCQVQLQLYKDHAQACQLWIEERSSTLAEYHTTLIEPKAITNDLALLQQAVSSAAGIKRSMQSKNAVYPVLETLFEQCIIAFDATEDNDDRLSDEFDGISDKQRQLNDDWERLKCLSRDTEQALRSLLRPAEIHHRIQTLLATLQAVQRDIEQANIGCLKDTQISDWQKRIDHIEATDYKRLVHQQTDAAQLDAVNDTLGHVRASLAALYDAVNNNRLRKTYLEQAEPVLARIRDLDAGLQSIYREHADVQSDRVARVRQALLTAHKELQPRINECKEAYEDTCAYQTFIATHGINDTAETHLQVEDAWTNLQSHQKDVVRLARQLNQWAGRFELVKEQRNQIQQIRRSIETRRSLSTLDSQLRAITETLEEERKAVTGQQDSQCAQDFLVQCKELLRACQTTQVSLTKVEGEVERAERISALEAQVQKQCHICEEQLAFMQQQAASHPSIAEKKVSSIQTVMQAYSEGLDSVRQMYQHIKSEMEDITETAVEQNLPTTVKRPLEKLMVELLASLQREEQYMGILKTVCRLAEREADVMAHLSEFKGTVARFSRSARIARTRGSLLPDLNEFDRRYKFMESSVEDFDRTVAQNKAAAAGLDEARRSQSILRAVERRDDAIQREWGRIRASAEETRIKLQETQMRQHASAKLSEVLRYVNELRHRVDTLSLKSSISMEQQELKDIQTEMQDILAKKIRDIDALLSTSLDKDGRLKRQRQDLATAVSELERQTASRQAQAEMEGNITLFIGIMDKMDSEITQLVQLIDKCAPHHARIQQQRFSKADLQNLLRTLVQGYKEREPKMANLVETAKAEARKQFVDNVVDRLDETVSRWHKAQADARRRERELQTCIGQLDHEFFTKLAMAKKKSSSDRQKNQQQPPQQQQQQQQQMPRRPSTPQRRQRSVPRRASGALTPTMPYVADPKNELDVRLAQVVNESPYQIRVRSVPDQVGKYWFGDRLVFCRILPSKMVMVRIGGGWIELAQFLKGQETAPNGLLRASSPASSVGSPGRSRGNSVLSASSSSSTATGKSGSAVDRRL
ncbi:hypothetical protein BCR43DRAFT_561375 [Syncephalastrum racemosum]|uniref:Calponin-homology (CH) domain-containing protein n=1 Tax=Syncephalastrum racemosum TaxID=13706 RepID=A0A1X2HNY3_SYNRA|nr:hypothetical protein BCR43DRAFT_561375 [Syncephalastrum racemosum]